MGRQRLCRKFGPVAGRLPRARLQEGLPRKAAHRVPGKVQREEVADKVSHRARVRLGQGEPRTVREDNRQGKGGGEDTRVVPYLQHVPDGCAYTPEMGLARAAGALRGEKPGRKARDEEGETPKTRLFYA